MTPLEKLHKTGNLEFRAAALQMGIDPSTYRKVALGLSRPSPKMADRIAKHFGNAVTRDQILFPTDYLAASSTEATSGPVPKVA